MPDSDCDRNLLFGILAVHNGFITRDALIGALSAWEEAKQTPLGQILVRNGALSLENHFLMEALVKAHLKQHDDDPGRSLAAINTTVLVKVLIDRASDPDIVARLAAHQPPTALGDASPAHADPPRAEGLGAPTSSGRRFHIIRAHAEGGLGVVYLARDEELNREVALKQIKTQFCTDRDSQARFVSEAEITGGLEHPGVVPVYGMGHDEQRRPYYAMRFIKGESLKDAIDHVHRAGRAGRNRAARAMELRKLLGRFIDVCEAIAYAHSRGVLHRDIKPANVMLGKYGETLVLDWGLAKAVGRDDVAKHSNPGELTLRPTSESDFAATAPGAAMGTPSFMSPEQAAGRLDDLGPASDVYSLGATLYYLLTGKIPFAGGDIDRIIWAVQRGEFPPPRQLDRSVPPPLEAICLKAMARHPGDRYASPEALAGEIEDWMADEPVSAYREGRLARLGRWARRHRQAVALAAAVLTVSTIALWIGLAIRQRQIRLVNDLRQANLADFALGMLHVRTNEFRRAEEVFSRAAQRLQGEPSLDDLRVQLRSRAQQVHRLVEFHRFAEQGERLEFDMAEDDALSCFEAALESIGVFDHDDWWDHLPVAGLEPRQIDRLRDETYRHIIYLAVIRAKAAVTLLMSPAAAPHCREGLRLLTPASRFRPHGQTARVIELFCRYGLGEKVKRLDRSEPRNAADYYFMGILHFWIDRIPKGPITQLATGRLRDLSGLDFKTSLATAERYFRTASALDPTDFWTNFWLGMTLLAGQKFEAAELAFNTCTAIRPDDAIGYAYRAHALRMLGQGSNPADRERFDRRVKADLERARALDPFNPQVHLASFLANATLDQVAQAVSDALRFLENERPVHTKSGWGVLDLRDEFLAVQRVLIQLGGRHAQRPDLQGALARAHLAYEESGENEKALQAAERALALRPGDPQATLVRSAVFLRRKEYKRAAEGFRAALAAVPGDYLAIQGLAKALELDGQLQDALELFHRTLPLAMRDWQRREIHQCRARVLTRLGRTADAALAESAARESGGPARHR
jgi:tetratricopeptide (TPR) repeat protein/tRNA A-37 threonylcarbamoyl transferase component Bud32